jgi:hypothetical protein
LLVVSTGRQSAGSGDCGRSIRTNGGISPLGRASGRGPKLNASLLNVETTMNSRSMYPVGLGVCLALLALTAAGQTTTSSSSHATTAPNKAATANSTANAPTGAATTAPASGAKKHHSTTHQQMHHEPQSMGAASAAGSRESAYRAALRTCVAGPAAQKERCLDDAIARHGRSR